MDLEGNDKRTISSASANKRMKNTSVSESANRRQLPRAVVAPELTSHHVSLRNAWVGTLREKRDISSAMKTVSNILPGMSHLKRCSGKRLILAFAAPNEIGDNPDRYYLVRQDLEDLLTNNGLDLSIFHEKFEIVSVPAYPQKTKAQASIASEIWPINFHPDPLIERILNGCWFNSKDLHIIEQCMGACIEAAARQAHGNQECNGSAIAFDPIENKIIAVAASRIDRHPMWHAAMLVIDLVASLGGSNAGAYDLTISCNESTEEKSLHASLSGSKIHPYELTASENEPKEKSLDVLAECQTRKRKYSMDENEQPVSYPTDLVDIAHRYTSQFSTIAGPVGSTKFCEKTAATGYLCTDYWIFLLREPCPLCAMALLHSRVSNVFYGIPNEYRGVLGSRALLHTTPGLNHRYRVWSGVREEECWKTFEEISLRMRTDTSSLSPNS